MARICLLRQDYFPDDVRLQREIDALCAAGHQVDIICERGPGDSPHQRHGQLTIRRLPIRHSRTGPVGYCLRYLGFLFGAAAWLTALHVRRPYDLVQANSVPDTLVFAAAILRLTGVPVLLDLHECMPEFFATKFKTSLIHPAVRILERLEQASIGFADSVITCNEETRARFVRRGAPPAKIAVVANSADESIFSSDRYPPRPRHPGSFVLISHGTIEDYYGLDTVIRAIALCVDSIPGLRLEIYGKGSHLAALRRLAKELHLDGHVYFSSRFLPVQSMPQIISNADVGVVAVGDTPHGRLMQPNKLFEFIALRKPVLASRTPAVLRHFDGSSLELFTPGDERDLARAMRLLHADPGRAERIAERALIVSRPYSWQRQREVYMKVVNKLLHQRVPPTGRESASQPSGTNRA